MYDFIRRIREMTAPAPRMQPQQPEQGLFADLKQNEEELRRLFHHASDLTIRPLRVGGKAADVLTIDNLVDKAILSEAIIRPLTRGMEEQKELTPERIRESLLFTENVQEVHTFRALIQTLLSGSAVIAVQGFAVMIASGVQGYRTRGISEPTADVVPRGSKEGFVESLRTNLSMIRRRMKTESLCSEMLTIGRLSHTEVCLCYVEGLVSPAILQEVRERLRKADLETVLAAGYVVPFLEKRRGFSFFTTVGITERPDTVCGKLSEGRIAVLIDGVPGALTVPFVLAEVFQTLDDYTNRPFFAAFTRWLKFAAFFVSMLLPGLFVALGTFHTEMYPTLLLNRIAAAMAHTPLSLTGETLAILFVYEMMRESGLRMPQPLGYAVSIVGGLVIGDTAVHAGLIGAPTLMVVAVAAISSYIIPNVYAPLSVLRLLFTVVGGLWGLWGIGALLFVVFVDVCSQESFGVPFTTPISPFGAQVFRDVALRADWRILSEKTETIQTMPGVNQP